MSHIELIVGLGNPGPQYEQTRHNAGFWLVDALAQSKGVAFRHDAKFHGELCRVDLHGHSVWLLKPLTFMNRSGQAVAALANFYKISPEQILVVHDELDIAPGALRLKQGGGHGGHNGLRDIAAQMGSQNYLRARVGIGHPGHSSLVSNYVLTKPSAQDREQILAALDAMQHQMDLMLKGEWQKAMNHLHSRPI